MAYYSILDVTPTDDKWVADYVVKSGEIVKKHGGKYLARTTSHQQIEGNTQEATLRIVLEWPSKQNVLDFMNDSEYIPHLKARTAGSISHHFLIEAKDDLA